MRMSLFCILSRMDQSQEAMEETVESINPMDLDPSVSGPSRSAVSEHVSTKALLKIYQDMARVLDRLTAPRAGYEKDFSRFSKYAPKPVLIETF